MAGFRIIIADTDERYAAALEREFMRTYPDAADLEIITEPECFGEVFALPQRAKLLLVSETLYEPHLCRHDIDTIFLLTEEDECGEDRPEQGRSRVRAERKAESIEINRIFKYTSPKEIFREIEARCRGGFNRIEKQTKKTQIILVYAACEEAGRTTTAMGLSACLADSPGRVLYLNAGHLQWFSCLLKNSAPIEGREIYLRLREERGDVYEAIRHEIRKEGFFYLPPFGAALSALDMDYGVYERIIRCAAASGDFDYVVVDADAVFDGDKMRLFGLADKIVVVTGQDFCCAYATGLLVRAIADAAGEKYVYVCSDFDKNRPNALLSPSLRLDFSVDEYIEREEGGEKRDWMKSRGLQRTAFLVR